MNSESEENADVATFHHYMESLDWGPGKRDESGWRAFLRAGSLGVETQKAVELVATTIRASGGSFNPSKIQSQARRAYAYVGSQSGQLNLANPPRTAFAPEKLKAMAGRVSGIDARWLYSRSPVSIDGVTSSDFLNSLYEKAEKILVFTHYESQGQHLHTVGIDEGDAIPTGSPDGVWFLVNPVDGEYHPNPRQDNKLSRRSEESITSWRYLVLESDVADANDWLACLVQLPLRISAIYTSGGKSIHALVRLDAVSKQHWDEERDLMKPIVVTLGADPNAMTAVRLSRLPGAMRGDRPQELLYLDPAPDGVPIVAKAHRA